jgi:hypothetical protein
MMIETTRFVLLAASAAALSLIWPPQSTVIDLTVTDAAGRTHTLSFGAHSAATDTMDFVLGELPVPPAPGEGTFDVRLIDPPGRSRGPSTGLYLDLRPLVSGDQIDTFAVSFRTEHSAYPMKFSAVQKLADVCDSIVVLVDHEGAFTREPVVNGGWAMTDAGVGRLVIIRYGVRGVLRGG